MEYGKFETEVLPYLEDLDEGLWDPATLTRTTPLVHDPPYQPCDEFLQFLEQNKKDCMQPGKQLSDDCMDELLLMGMPNDMAERRRGFAQRPAVFMSIEDVEKELQKRLQSADLKFFLSKFNVPLHGTKSVMLQRLLEARHTNLVELAISATVPGTPKDVAETIREAVAKCRGEAIEEVARLYYVRLKPEEEDVGNESAPAPPAAAAGEQAHYHVHNAPAGDMVDATRMEEVITGVLSMSEEAREKKPELVYVFIDKQTGKKYVEVFIDLLDIDRSQYPLGGNFSVRFTQWRQGPYDKCSKIDCAGRQCNCHKPVILIGQDEAIYKSFAMKKKQWLIPSLESTFGDVSLVRCMRKKGMQRWQAGGNGSNGQQCLLQSSSTACQCWSFQTCKGDRKTRNHRIRHGVYVCVVVQGKEQVG